MAEYIEFYIDRGADFSKVISIENDSNNMAQNIANCVVTCQMKRSLVSPNAYTDIHCTVTDAANGEITMYLSGSETGLIRPGTYFYDLKVNDLDNSANTRLIEGMMYVSYNITG